MSAVKEVVGGRYTMFLARRQLYGWVCPLLWLGMNAASVEEMAR